MTFLEDPILPKNSIIIFKSMPSPKTVVYLGENYWLSPFGFVFRDINFTSIVIDFIRKDIVVVFE